MQRNVTLLSLAIAAVTALLGCSGLTNAELRQVNPRLTDLKFTVAEPTQHQALEIVGTVAWGEELRETEFAPVSLRTGTGEQLQVRLTTGACRSPTGARIMCDVLFLSLHEGRSISELDELLEEIDAQRLRFWEAEAVVGGSVQVFYQGSIRVFSGDLAEALERVAEHPAVRIVEYDIILELGEQVQQQIRGAVRTDRSSTTRPAPGVAASPGDSVIAEYRQPDGSVVRAIAVVQ